MLHVIFIRSLLSVYIIVVVVVVIIIQRLAIIIYYCQMRSTGGFHWKKSELSSADFCWDAPRVSLRHVFYTTHT